jgi:hypothetical protein
MPGDPRRLGLNNYHVIETLGEVILARSDQEPSRRVRKKAGRTERRQDRAWLVGLACVTHLDLTHYQIDSNSRLADNARHRANCVAVVLGFYLL